MPAYRGKRLTRLMMKRDIERLMDIFPKVRVRIKRLKEKFSPIGEAVPAEYLLIYEGEALVRPVSGETEGYGLGTTEQLSLVILINGKKDARQGDVVTVNDGREYEVDLPPDYWSAFTVLNLQQRSQIAQPVQ